MTSIIIQTHAGKSNEQGRHVVNARSLPCAKSNVKILHFDGNCPFPAHIIYTENL